MWSFILAASMYSKAIDNNYRDTGFKEQSLEIDFNRKCIIEQTEDGMIKPTDSQDIDASP